MLGHRYFRNGYLLDLLFLFSDFLRRRFSSSDDSESAPDDELLVSFRLLCFLWRFLCILACEKEVQSKI